MALTYVVNDSSLKTNLVSWWGLDEPSAAAAAVTRYDAHGTNHLTDNNTTASATGKVNKGADFETANSEYLSKTDTADLSFTGDFSFSGWVNLESLAANQCIFGKWNATGDQRSYAFFINTSGALRVYISSNGTNLNTTKLTFSHTALSTATWYHLAFSYTASSGVVDFWINGAAQTQLTGNSTSVFNSTADFGLGNAFGDFGFFDGIMDECAVWSRQLTGAEVTRLYNSGDGMSYGISFDNASGPNVSNPVTSQTTAFTTTGTDRFLYVWVLGDSAATTGISGITYAGTAMTYLSTHRVSTDRSFDVYYLANPTSGSNNVVITRGVSGLIVSGFVSYTGVHQTTPVPTNTTFTDTNNDTTIDSASITTVNNYAWAVFGTRDGTGRVITAGSGLVIRATNSSNGMHLGDSGGDIATAGSHTFNATLDAAAPNIGGILFEMKSVSAAAGGTTTRRLTLLGAG